MEQVIEKMNSFGRECKPFVFLIDFDMKNPLCFSLEELESENIHIQFPEFSTSGVDQEDLTSLKWEPIAYEKYLASFNIVQDHIRYGNTFLCNLTMSTPIELNGSLSQIYAATKAKYKINFKDEWVCFSPETFVQIQENKIFTYPMKGTIDAHLPNARELLMNNPKEIAEHYTIVDLLRNDLALVSKNVRVTKFRYLDHLTTNRKDLFQASSEIVGDLDPHWKSMIGNIIHTMLPAGSISGAPKKKTVEIIHQAEQHPEGRQFYTGVAGYFDGMSLDSCVLIRYIYNHKGQYYYCSGGGITMNSQPEIEYQELLDKIYLPQ